MTIAHAIRPPPVSRLAARIHELLQQRQQNVHRSLFSTLNRLTDRMEQIASLKRKIAMAERRGWVLAQAHLLVELRCTLTYLPNDSRSAELAIPPKVAVSSVADIAREFEQIDDEFGGWAFEKPHILIAVTEPITLEDIHLGVFEIRLNLDQLAHQSVGAVYELVARTPHPASCNESVTHPHVRDKELCEGDAAHPIAAALAEGRLCDFFMLVRSVLQTYNPHSPHVALDSWSGIPCHDCSSVIGDEDGSYYCEGCDRDFCDGCISYCRCCDASRCMSCLEECPHCDDKTCGSCMEGCRDCGKPCCRDCLEEGVCPACQDDKNNQNKETSHDDIYEPALACAGASVDDGEDGKTCEKHRHPHPNPQTPETPGGVSL